MSSDIVSEKFLEWTRGKEPKEARIKIFEEIRNIPFAIVPELNHPQRYQEILKIGKGSCTPKHLLMAEMFERLGILVLYLIYQFSWNEFEIDYPPELKKLIQEMPISYHLACQAEIEGKPVLVDATLDPPLEKLGLPVNKKWDGLSDALLAVKPLREAEPYHPSEIYLMEVPALDEKPLAFYNKLNSWLDRVRKND